MTGLDLAAIKARSYAAARVGLFDRGTFTDTSALIAEVERLRKALARIQQWDMLNPPQTQQIADAQWLRNLVDKALGGTDE